MCQVRRREELAQDRTAAQWGSEVLIPRQRLHSLGGPGQVLRVEKPVLYILVFGTPGLDLICVPLGCHLTPQPPGPPHTVEYHSYMVKTRLCHGPLKT